jgi:enamidase
MQCAIGMVKSITEMTTLSKYPLEWRIAAATGNVAKVYRLNNGFLREGKDSDLLLVDAPMGGSKTTCLDALMNGDVWSLVACFTDGLRRFIGRSRNTPPTLRYPKVLTSRIANEFSASQQFK